MEYRVSFFINKCQKYIPPDALHNIFTHKKTVTARRTHNNETFYIPHTRLTCYSTSTFQQASRLWNNLPASIQQATTLNLLKIRLKAHYRGMWVNNMAVSNIMTAAGKAQLQSHPHIHWPLIKSIYYFIHLGSYTASRIICILMTNDPHRGIT